MTYCLSSIVCYCGSIFVTFSQKCPGFPTDIMPSFFIKMCHVTKFWHPLCPLLCFASSPTICTSRHPGIRRFLAAKARAVFSLTLCAQFCSKDFVSSKGLACHIPSVPYCCQSWLSVSNGLPIDNIVLPTHAPSFCQDPGNHSLDNADDDYHPIYAT